VQPDLSPQPSLRHHLSKHGEAVAFAGLVLAYLLPVWLFPYVPTQDGPSHLSNAQILKDYGDPAAGYDTFFELRPEPLPNWTSHLLLAALLYLVPALVAEKLLVSVYIAGFAVSYRWFLGAFGPRCRPLAWVGLLLVYQRCFWMGFYNYCLSLILVWVILGLCLRWRDRLHAPQLAGLMVLFLAAYFTHLVGFLVALTGALLAALLVPPTMRSDRLPVALLRRGLAAVLIGVAALPAACLMMHYFEQTGFFRDRSARRLFQEPLARLRGARMETTVWTELPRIDDELFAHHVGHAIPGSLVLAGYLGLLLVVTVAGRRDPEPDRPGWLFPAVFGFLLLAGFVLIPEDLGFSHGGFLKGRLAPLPPLLWLACLREPAQRWLRLPVRAVTVLLLAANLALVVHTLEIGNREVAEYTAGIDAAGRDHRLFVMQANPSPPPLVDPLLHAADYYCLGTGTINLDNYEAGTPHFPVKFHTGVGRGSGSLAGYSHQPLVDLVLCWQVAPARSLAGWHEVFNRGRLRIYRRPPGG
jgi:hypothetical protein